MESVPPRVPQILPAAGVDAGCEHTQPFPLPSLALFPGTCVVAPAERFAPASSLAPSTFPASLPLEEGRAPSDRAPRRPPGARSAQAQLTARSSSSPHTDFIVPVFFCCSFFF